MTGLVFNIQRFSVNDGPGIRTTVFLKGCPLHCRWCHNPESISPKKELILREDRCIRCGDCMNLCKNGAISNPDGVIVTSRDLCKQCGDCVQLCYAEAREIVGKEMTVEEVAREIEKDAIFFNESSGGVSFSGGEPLLQYEFLLAVLRACKQKGLHTVVDTTGYTAPTIMERILPHVDLFLYDLKTLDDSKHKEYTGVSNRLVLENLQLLVRWKKEIIVRIPVIPGVNDTLEDIQQIGSFVAAIGGIRQIQLLAYHQTGIDKYHRLGLEYQMPHVVPPTTETMNEIAGELGNHVSFVSLGG
jgi:pyruvate formate lyase activating enzyme